MPVLVGLNVIPGVRVFAGAYFDIFLSGKTTGKSPGWNAETRMGFRFFLPTAVPVPALKLVF